MSIVKAARIPMGHIKLLIALIILFVGSAAVFMPQNSEAFYRTFDPSCPTNPGVGFSGTTHTPSNMPSSIYDYLNTADCRGLSPSSSFFVTVGNNFTTNSIRVPAGTTNVQLAFHGAATVGTIASSAVITRYNVVDSAVVSGPPGSFLYNIDGGNVQTDLSGGPNRAGYSSRAPANYFNLGAPPGGFTTTGNYTINLGVRVAQSFNNRGNACVANGAPTSGLSGSNCPRSVIGAVITVVVDPAPVRGCTDPSATNYNPAATVNDGSCLYDQCSNISGNQNSIPAGYVRASGNRCLLPPPTCSPANRTVTAGAAFTTTANYRNNASITLDVTGVRYSGAASGTSSSANLGANANRTYTTNSSSINGPGSYTITWRMDYNTLYGSQNVQCNSTITVNNRVFSCGPRRNESVNAGQTFNTYVNIINPNPTTVRATPISYTILGAPAGTTRPSGSGSPNSINVPGNNGSRRSDANGIRIIVEGVYTIRWTIASPSGPRTCDGTISVIFTPPTCTATLPTIDTGESNRPTFTFRNNSNVPLQVTSATYTITGAAPFNGIFTTGFTPPVGASTTSNATYPTYPPAAEVGPFPVAGRYRLTWTTISYNAAGVNRTLTNCGISDSTVSDVPYLRAYGNDVVTCDLPGTADYNGEIRASGTYVGSPSNQANWRGSASELAFFAAGRVRGFMPGAMRNRPSTIALSFANVAGTFATNGSQNFGGRFGGGCEIRELPDPTGFSSGGNLGQLNSLDGRYQRTANTTIATSPSLSITNRNIVIYVAGDVTIANNITYNTGTWNIDTIPSVKVFATGNIYIRPGVTQLDGEYVAGGQLLTCATTSSFPSDATINSSCRTPLVINGNIKAQRIHYLRAVGSLLSGTSFEGHASPNIAESIRFSPDAYLLPDGGGLAPDPGGSPPYDSIIARPPTF